MSSSKSSLTTALVTAASIAAVSVAALTIHRRFSRKQERKKSHPRGTSSASLQFEDGSQESQVQARFEACVKIMGPQIPKLPQKIQLEYYGIFKQATLGDCTEYHSCPPPAYDLVARAKYNAWKHCSGMDRVAAMQEYIDKVVQFEYVKSIGGDSNDDDDDYELEGDAAIDVVGMGNKPSTLVLDDDVFYDAGDDDTMFPLHAAAREGRLEEVESILSMKSDADNTLPNSIDSSGQTPLHLAADQGHVDVVKTLILNGADIHIVDNDGISILQAAVIGGNVDCCRILLSLGADPHQRDEDGDTPFDSAKDDEDLKVLFEEHEKSPLKLNDTELIRKLGEQWNEAPVDVKEELKKLEQSIVLDLDDDGDI